MKSNKFGRRQFIKQSAFTAIVPTIISATAIGKTTPPPSERVNLGFIGVGGRGSNLLKNALYDQNIQVAAVSDCFGSRRKNALNSISELYKKQSRTSGAKEYADYRDLLARKDIDGVVIATPDQWHIPVAIHALNAGKDIYLEKPLGIDVEYAFKLRKLVQDKKAIFQYGTQQRSNYYFRFGCELVRNGYIGELKTIDAWCPSLGYSPSVAEKWPADIPSKKPPADLDYDRWLGPAPVAPYNDVRVTRLGAWHIYDYALGFIAGWGAHPLDIAQWGNNTDDTAPISYEGTGKINEGTLFNTIGTWDINCKYANGVDMHFTDNFTAEPIVSKYLRRVNNHGTTFHGTEGWVNVSRGGLLTSDDKLRKVKLKDTDIRLIESKNHISNFADCIKSRKKPIAPIESAVQSDLISHLSNALIRHNCSVKWDPKKEQVIGNTELSKALNRKMRKPWTV